MRPSLVTKKPMVIRRVMTTIKMTAKTMATSARMTRTRWRFFCCSRSAKSIYYILYHFCLISAKDSLPEAFEEGGLVGGHGGFGGFRGVRRGFGDIVGIGVGVDLLGGDEEPIARGAKRGAGDKGEHRLIGVIDEGFDVGGFDDFLLGDLVGVASGFVVDVDEVAVLEAFEAGEDEFVRVTAVNVAGGVAGDDEVADLPR